MYRVTSLNKQNYLVWGRGNLANTINNCLSLSEIEDFDLIIIQLENFLYNVLIFFILNKI